MTREEALEIWLPVIKMGVESMQECNEALDMAIKALQQEPCADAISREAVLKAIDAKAWEFCDYLISKGRNDEQKPVSHFADNLRECISKDLPPVKPQYTDAEIQKMQDLEFAEIQKAYEIGKEEGSIGADVLDKIRTEIMDINIVRDEYSQRQNDYCDGVEFAKRYVLQIIDKYKASPTGEEAEE